MHYPAAGKRRVTVIIMLDGPFSVGKTTIAQARCSEPLPSPVCSVRKAKTLQHEREAPIRARLNMTLTLPVLALLATLALVAAPPALAADPPRFYVALGGSDRNPGTQARPFRSIQHALNVARTPGTTIYVRQGVYRELLRFPHDGAPGRPITLRDAPGGRPVISGVALTAEQLALVEIRDRKHVRLEGFEITKFVSSLSSAAVFVIGGSESVEVIGNTLHDIRHTLGVEGEMRGIAAYSTENREHRNLLIAGNTLYNISTGYSEVLSLAGNVVDFRVESNTAHHNFTNPVFLASGVRSEDGSSIFAVGREEWVDPGDTRDGVFRDNHIYANVDPSRGGIGIYVNGGRNILIERNRIHDNHTGIYVNGENPAVHAQNITIQNNLVYRNLTVGIGVGPEGERGSALEGGRVTGVLVRHNTLVNNGHSSDWGGAGSLYVGRVNNARFVNNLVVTATEGDGAHKALTVGNVQHRAVLDHNLYFVPGGAVPLFVWPLGRQYEGLAAFQVATGNEANGIVADPQLRADASGDWRPGPRSPALDAGSPADAPKEDLVGAPRPRVRGPDLGAYEIP